RLGVARTQPKLRLPPPPPQPPPHPPRQYRRDVRAARLAAQGFAENPEARARRKPCHRGHPSDALLSAAGAGGARSLLGLSDFRLGARGGEVRRRRLRQLHSPLRPPPPP